jgi:ankyrin repeat protein
LLHEAVAWPNPLQIVQLLIERGIDVNLIEENGRTPLHELIRCCRNESESLVAVVEYLIDHGANPNALDSQCKSPLYPFTRIVANPQYLLYSFYIDNLRRFYALTSCQKADLLKCLLGKGADPNLANMKGNTIAHEAFLLHPHTIDALFTFSSRANIVPMLLSKKANFLKENHEGKIPIDMMSHQIEPYQLYHLILKSRHLASLEDCFNLEFTSDLCVMLNSFPEKYFVHRAVLQVRCPKLASHFKGNHPDILEISIALQLNI